MKKDKNKERSPVAIWLEYIAVCVLAAVVPRLPESVAAALGRTLGRLAWRGNRKKRELAQQNIRLAMPGTSDAEAERIARASFINLGLNAMEMLWLNARLTKAVVEERMKVDGLDAVQAEIQNGGSVLAITLHLGNWELFGSSMSVVLGGISAVARSSGNPLLEKLLKRYRDSVGIRPLDRDQGVRQIVNAIRSPGATAILMDQHVRTACLPLKFFGRLASTTTVPAALALRFDTHVYLAYSWREGQRFRHRGRVERVELIRTGSGGDADVEATTQLFNDLLERAIREHPEQWLWAYRRWRLADREDGLIKKKEKPDVA